MPVLALIPSTSTPTGSSVVSQPSLEVSFITTTDYWWLVDCETMASSGIVTGTGVPGAALTLEVKNTGLAETLSETQAQHITLGSEYMTILADTIKGATFSLLVDFLDDASWQAFITMRNLQKTLLLIAPYGAQWYVRIGADVIPSLTNAASVYREVTFEVIEQPRP